MSPRSGACGPCPGPSAPGAITARASTARASTRAALSVFSKHLSKEVSPKGVRALRMAPGWIGTEASASLAERLATEAGTDVAGGKRLILAARERYPPGSPSSPDEIANRVAFSVSDRAASKTGVEYVINGGAGANRPNGAERGGCQQASARLRS